MVQRDLSGYTQEERREAQRLKEDYQKQGVGEDEAEELAWAQINKAKVPGKEDASKEAPDPNRPSVEGGQGGVASRKRDKHDYY